MSTSQMAEGGVQVALVSAGRNAILAVGHIAKHFGLSLAEAEALMERGHGLIARAVPKAKAMAALPVLTALGVKVSIQPKTSEPASERFDLAIRLKSAEAIVQVRSALNALGFQREVAPDDFRRPAGLVIQNLTLARAEDHQAGLAALRDVTVTICPQGRAVYDVFAPANGSADGLARVLRYISVLGCSAQDHCPPIAVDLDRQMLACLLARFPNAGLIGVNQAFQRYDLTLTGAGRLSRQDMADFLATRGVATPSLTGAARGLRLETGLTRSAAKQFVADYATIGITVRADLIHG